MLQRMIALAAAATLAAAAIVPAAASEGATTAKRVKETRYCVHRHKAGAAPMEKYCKTRAQWLRQDGVDPAKHRRH